MNETLPAQFPVSKRALYGNLAILAGLFVLRFGVLIIPTFFTGSGTPAPFVLLYRVGTYILTAWLIWRERARLRVFWIDVVAMAMFVVQRILFLIGLGLWAGMLIKRQPLPKPPRHIVRSMLLGVTAALVFSVLVQYSGLNWPDPRSAVPAGSTYLVGYAIMQLSNAALMEEPLFRGFLWGYLRLAGWRNLWIWLFQAALFTLGHIYYLNFESPGNYLIRLLLPSLLLGLIAWKSGSIAASMAAHMYLNASSDMLMHATSLADAYRLSLGLAGVLVAMVVLLTLVSRWRGEQRGWEYI